MNFERAKQIVNSPDNIQVLYKNQSIWIEDLNEINQTASVTTDSHFENRMTVPVTELKEGNTKH